MTDGLVALPEHRRVRRRTRSVLITDLDNTLYDFVSYYEAGLAAVIEELTSELRLARQEAIDQLREVFRLRGTIEYSFAIEDIREVRSLPDSLRAEFVRHAVAAFWISAAQALQPYRTVVETLAHLHQQDVAIIAYTDAPMHEAMRRLHHLGCDTYLTGIVAQRGVRRGRRRSMLLLRELPGHATPSRSASIVWRIGPDELKPNQQAYERIAAHLSFGASDIVVIGDSVPRDLIPALELGFTGVWARYGRRDRRSEGLLQSLVPSILPEARGAPEIPASLPIADTFQDVVRYLPIQQVLPFT
jgi:FMN phosphatase YigB (HAD superfamily)